MGDVTAAISIRLDCKCGYRRLARFTRSEGCDDWFPALVGWPIEECAGGAGGASIRYRIRCRSEHCGGDYQLRIDKLEGRLDQAAKYQESVLVLGVDV